MKNRNMTKVSNISQKSTKALICYLMTVNYSGLEILAILHMRLMASVSRTWVSDFSVFGKRY